MTKPKNPGDATAQREALKMQQECHSELARKAPEHLSALLALILGDKYYEECRGTERAIKMAEEKISRWLERDEEREDW